MLTVRTCLCITGALACQYASLCLNKFIIIIILFYIYFTKIETRAIKDISQWRGSSRLCGLSVGRKLEYPEKTHWSVLVTTDHPGGGGCPGEKTEH